MKIKCEYCGTFIDDTNANCPNCGAACSGVKRAVSKQPMTIAELQQWYADRNLPPSKVTRFFIGEDCKEPRAFGIYKEPNSKNFVVYKNKDSGERAVRYRGTDEAYAVNELYQRLKQEILQQKAAGKSRGSSRSAGSSRSTAASGKQKPGCLKIGCLSFVLLFILTFIASGISVLIENEPKTGYYTYNGSAYYYLDSSSDSSYDSWFQYDPGQKSWNLTWSRSQDNELRPAALKKNRTAKSYYLQPDWDASLPCTDVADSQCFGDINSGYTVTTGYYQYDDCYYYHLEQAADSGWYYYDYGDDYWLPVSDSSIPEELTHTNSSSDYYCVNGWDSSTQISDFANTSYYTDYYDHDTGSSSSWHDDDDSSYDWDWDSDSWDSGSSDWDSDW